jgi:hypothetical protein
MNALPSVVTVVAVPALQRPVVGVVGTVVLLAGPHVPLVVVIVLPEDDPLLLVLPELPLEPPSTTPPELDPPEEPPELPLLDPPDELPATVPPELDVLVPLLEFVLPPELEAQLPPELGPVLALHELPMLFGPGPGSATKPVTLPPPSPPDGP